MILTEDEIRVINNSNRTLFFILDLNFNEASFDINIFDDEFMLVFVPQSIKALSSHPLHCLLKSIYLLLP